MPRKKEAPTSYNITQRKVQVEPEPVINHAQILVSELADSHIGIKFLSYIENNLCGRDKYKFSMSNTDENVMKILAARESVWLDIAQHLTLENKMSLLKVKEEVSKYGC